MSNPILEALEGIGNIVSLPGQAVRGVLAGDPGSLLSGKQLLQKYGLVGDDQEGFGGGDIAGIAADLATDPLMLLGSGFLGGKAAASAAKGSGVKAMLPLRRQFAMVKDAVPAKGFFPNAPGVVSAIEDPAISLTGRAVPSPAGEIGQKFAADRMGRSLGKFSGIEDLNNTAGFYDRSNDIGMTWLGEGSGTLRHELTHGMIDQAGKAARAGGSTSGLPLVMRLPAHMGNSSSPLVRALGIIGDEAAANYVGGHGGMEGAKAAWNFLTHPQPFYESQLRGLSPLVADLYGSNAIGQAPYAAGILGGGGIAGAGIYGLMGGGKP